jgi:hypothetical protein
MWEVVDGAGEGWAMSVAGLCKSVAMSVGRAETSNHHPVIVVFQC